MSQDQSHGSDRAAAYRGLILGAIVLGAVLYTVVKLTHAHYAGSEASKTSQLSAAAALGVRLDS